MAFGTALGAGLGGHTSFVNLGQFGSDDSGRHCNDPVANDHYDRRQRLTETGLRRYIPVTDSRQGNNGPVNTFGNTRESGIRFFDKVHQRAKDND